MNGTGGIGGLANNLTLSKNIPLIYTLEIPTTAKVAAIKNTITKFQTQFFGNANMLGIGLSDYDTVAGFDLSNGTIPVPPTQTNRSMWVWGYTNILDNPADIQKLLTFVKAPFGNPNAAINRIFLEAPPAYLSGTNVTKIKSFIKAASAQGLQVEFLAGDAQ